MLYGRETWSIKGDDVTKLEKNVTGMVKWLVRPEDTISAVKSKNTLQLNALGNVCKEQTKVWSSRKNVREFQA